MSNSRRASVVGLDAVFAMPEDTRPWYKVSHLAKLNLITLSLLMCSGTTGYDGSMMNGLQSLHQWQKFMHHPTGEWLGFINAIKSVGGLVTFPIQAYSADRYGRKICLQIGLAFIIFGAALQTGARNQGMFIAARFLIGVASTWFATAAILITEIAYPYHRAKCTALYNCQFYVGSLISAGVAFGVRNCSTSWPWRIPSLLQIAIPVLARYGILLAPESLRWLISKNRNGEARAMLTKYHAGGDGTSAIVIFEMTQIEKTLALEREAKESASYMGMFKTKGNCHRVFITVTLGVFGQWVGNVLSYDLAIVLTQIGITSVSQQTGLNVGLNFWNLIWADSAALLVGRVGRRKLFLTSAATMLSAYVVITVLSGTYAKTGVASVGTAVIPFLFIFFGGYDIAFTPFLVSYPAEIWGFALRARDIAVVLGSTYLALLFNVFVNPTALGSIAWKYYLVFVAVGIIASITIWFTYPETRGHNLEEMAVVFDGDDAVIPSSREVLGSIEHTDTYKHNKGVTSHVEIQNGEKM